MSKAEVSIWRVVSGGGEASFTIDIIDVASGAHVSARLSPADFANAVTGRGNNPAEAEWCVQKIGMRHETKEEFVTYVRPDPGGNPEIVGQAKADALRPYEVDGWLGRPDDLGNSNRMRVEPKKIDYRVTFDRWVSQ